MQKTSRNSLTKFDSRLSLLSCPGLSSSSGVLPPHVGTQAVEQEPSALVSCGLQSWVQIQLLPINSPCPRVPPVSWMQQSTSLSTTRRKFGHTHYICRIELCTHQQITHETSAGGSNSGACVPTCVGWGDGWYMTSVWMCWAISSCY